MPGVPHFRTTLSPVGAPSARPPRKLSLNATLLCVVAALLPDASSHAQGIAAGGGTAQQQGVRTYDVEPGPLADVLTRFAQQAGVLLSFDAAGLQGRRSSGVKGAHAVDEGFRQVLAGSGFEAVATGGNRYVLRPAVPDLAAEDSRAARNAVELDRVVVTGQRTRDEAGHDDVYEKDIANAYVDRKYMERYRGVSVGDVFAGVNGVYNTDNRNGSALFPNIRGLSGNGRIPVTVDGTQQSLDVWMALKGINNRSYVDPNLFRSIEVEKGPSMTRGIKSGIGGSVAIRTIEAADIIPPGQNWGAEIKLGTASNSVKDSSDPFSIVGKDYRDIPGAFAATPWANPGLAFSQPWAGMRARDDTSRFNLADRKLFLSGAYQHDAFDVLAAYSNARRGNYFAGTKGADRYMQNAAPNAAVLSAQNLYPNIARVYAPGYEVPYTSTQAESILVKNNWKLPNDQKISLSFSRNQLEFGELPAVASELFMGLVDQDPSFNLARTRFQYPYPPTTVDQDVYRLGYEIKPEGSDWLDLEMALWRTVNESTRYQNGDTTYQVAERDGTWDDWVACHNTTDPDRQATCQLLIDWGLLNPADQPPARQPNTDGRYDVFIGNRQDTRVTRTGFDMSNRFRLSDTLALTAAADWQYERRTDHVPVETAVIGGGLTTVAFGPASGRREEQGASVNLEWRATDRLLIGAGVRYGAFWGFDDETDQRRAAQDELWKSTGLNTHQKIPYHRLASDEEMATMARIQALDADVVAAWDNWSAAGGGVFSGPLWDAIQTTAAARDTVAQSFEDYKAASGITSSWVDYETGLQWWNAEAAVPLQDGKADRSQNPFSNGQIDPAETVENPQGVSGTFQKYKVVVPGIYGDFVRQSSADPWRRPEKQRAHAWSSQLVASYLLGDRARVYGRLVSMARFPSVMEMANRIGVSGEFAFSPKPERSNAWEVGYAYDLSGLLPALQRADVKLGYYHNTIRNFYDRSYAMTTLQFDRKIMSGVELQSRFDTGRFYGGLGATWRKRQDTCDADYAAQLDPHYNRLPECMPGGFFGTMAFLSMQPKYSLNLDLGTRLLERKLDLGARVRHHSRTENDKLDRILQASTSPAYAYTLQVGNTRPYYWEPVTLVDLYAEYRFDRNTTLRLSVDNLTDRYYLDPLTKVAAPGPGRTVIVEAAFRF